MVNALSDCPTGGSCAYNIAGSCTGQCGVNVLGDCTPAGACLVNVAGPCYYPSGCQINVLDWCPYFYPVFNFRSTV